MVSKTPPPKPAQLRDAFKQDLTSCWQKTRSLHPADTPYAFVLHGLEGTPHLYPEFLTEEGLMQVATRYVAEGYHETVDEARHELRYSIEDSPYAGELEDCLPTVDALVEPHEADWDETEGYELLANAAIQAFTALDKAGTFGKGKQREKLLLMIETSLAEKDWTAPSVKRLNSRSAFRRYEKETKEEGPYASADELAFSKDGRSLFYRGYREINPRSDTYGELVACDVVGLKAKRKWHIRFSNFGARTKALDCTANKTVFFMRSKNSEDKQDKWTEVLMRIAGGAKAGVKQIELPTEALDGAITADGSRIVVITPDKKLHFYDENLKLLQSHKVQTSLSRLRFLKSGDLVAIAKKQIVRLDSSLRMKALPYRGNPFRMSFDQDEKLCAISGWPKSSGLICDQKPRDQLGFDVVRFPEMKVMRSFLIPAHQLTWATLSSDGKYVASNGRECGKYVEFVVVYDVNSGREIARRKLDPVHDMAFVPGKNILALSTHGHTKGEPIVFWPLPPEPRE